MARNISSEEAEQDRINAMGRKLGRFYSLLVDECTFLHLQWSEFNELFGTNPDRIEVLNRSAPGFFRMVQDRLWEASLLHIARLTDAQATFGKRGKDNVTILALTPMVDAALQPKIEVLVGVAQHECQFAKDWRNRRIAHRDLGLAQREGASPLAPASRASVKKALWAIAEVLNAVESHYMCAEVAYELTMSSRGAKVLLHVLRDGIEAREARHQRLRSGAPLPEDIRPKRPL
jgi:hypothetical protein